MIDTSANCLNDARLQALCEFVHANPVLRERLFALDDPEDFIAELRLVARSLGHELEDSEVSQAMNAGRKAWFERRLP